jgi:hypothetical protein
VVGKHSTNGFRLRDASEEDNVAKDIHVPLDHKRIKNSHPLQIISFSLSNPSYFQKKRVASHIDPILDMVDGNVILFKNVTTRSNKRKGKVDNAEGKK